MNVATKILISLLVLNFLGILFFTVKWTRNDIPFSSVIRAGSSIYRDLSGFMNTLCTRVGPRQLIDIPQVIENINLIFSLKQHVLMSKRAF